MKSSYEELLTRGVLEVIEGPHLAARLKKGDTLRVKLGIDPTAPDLHLGHTVPLRKLRQFQNAGHTAVLIIGDFTARIGDPSFRSSARHPLTANQVKKNEEQYLEQAFKILDQSKTEVRRNSEWFGKMDLGAFITNVATSFTKQQLQERNDFKDREEKNLSISIAEFLYPLLQGYDSVQVNADVEIGGKDQLWNLLTARKMHLQDILTVPLLLGIDGHRKMSKTFDNTINLNDLPNEMYGKVMSIPDHQILPYFELVTDLEFEALEKVKQEIKGGNPRDAKAHLAHLIVEMVRDAPAAEAAEAEFNRIFRDKEMPSDIPTFDLPHKKLGVVDLLIATRLTESRSQAVRLIEQGGVRVQGKRISSPKAEIEVTDLLIQVGKRRFAHARSKGKKFT